MLLQYNIQCNECYTTTWRESKYTLLHFDQRHRKRGSALKAAMDKMDEEHGIKGSIIHGYETLSSNTKDEQVISDHPGFKRIVQQLNSNKDELRIWLQEGDVMTNKKGVLWNHLEIRDPALMTRGQLMEKATQLQIVNQKYHTLTEAHDALQAAFTAQGRELIQEKNQGNDFFKQLCEKIDECKNLKIELNSFRRRLAALENKK
jgi:hypothetical protein